jgi:hypothetical protein
VIEDAGPVLVFAGVSVTEAVIISGRRVQVGTLVREAVGWIVIVGVQVAGCWIMVAVVVGV